MTVKRGEITRPHLAKTFKILRTSQGLSQKELAERAKRFRGQGFPCLLVSQVSDYELGNAMPGVETLVSLLAASSPDGETVDFTRLQRACGVPIDAAPPASFPAFASGGEYLVEPTGQGFAVKTTAGITAMFTDPWRAWLMAAILPQTHRGLLYKQIRRDDGGFDLTREAEGIVGWIRWHNPEAIEALHVLDAVLSSPPALASLLHAVPLRQSVSTSWPAAMDPEKGIDRR